jgi:dTDP-4-dehydrorhamnose reductase
MNILLLGATGQVGSALQKTAPPGFHLLCPSHLWLDLADLDKLAVRIREYDVRAVINAAAYTKVDLAESKQELAHCINAQAVGIIAKWCAEQGIPLVQYSTDYVFDGQSSKPYLPGDEPNPLSVYGSTKLAGENQALKHCSASYVIRTSWVYGVYGYNFVKTMLHLAQDKDELSVINDQIGTSTNSTHLARLTWKVLDSLPDNRILHFSNQGQQTWYDFAGQIFATAEKLNILDGQPNVLPISSEEFNAAAVRPSYSVLDTSATQACIDYKPVDCQDALRETLVGLKS